MKTINRSNLLIFLNYYFNIEGDILPSRKIISSKLYITESQIRTLISLFKKVNFIYKKNKYYYINKTVHNVENPIEEKDNLANIKYFGRNYCICINKSEITKMTNALADKSIVNILYCLLIILSEHNLNVKLKVDMLCNKIFNKIEGYVNNLHVFTFKYQIFY